MQKDSRQIQDELYQEELKKIDIQEVRAYLLGNNWEQQGSKYEPRAQVYVNEDGNMLLLPVDSKLSDFYTRLSEALQVIATTEQIWLPYVVMRFVHAHPIQTSPAVGETLGIARQTLTRAHNSGALGSASYRSGDTILINMVHPDFTKWLKEHESTPRTMGYRKKQISQNM